MSITDAEGWMAPEDPNDASIRAGGDGTYAMRFERFVPRPAEKVWAVLVTPQRIAEWLGEAVDLDLRVGGRYLVLFPGGRNDVIGGAIVAYDPPHLLAYEVNGTGGDSVVTWALTPEAGGCRLVFTQSGMIPWWFFGGMAGWHQMIDEAIAVATGEPLREPGTYRDLWRRYERTWGVQVPGFDVRPALRHHEAEALVTPAGDGAYDLKFVRRYMLPMQKVWGALTEPARLSDWLAKARIDLRVGGEVELSWPSHRHIDRHVILALEPGRLMVWGPADGQNPKAMVRWEFYQEDPKMMGVRLMLINTDVAAEHLLSVATGWHAHLHDFPDAALRETPLPWTAEREEARSERERAELIERYRARLARQGIG